jgi:hypothetical protein
VMPFAPESSGPNDERQSSPSRGPQITASPTRYFKISLYHSLPSDHRRQQQSPAFPEGLAAAAYLGARAAPGHGGTTGSSPAPRFASLQAEGKPTYPRENRPCNRDDTRAARGARGPRASERATTRGRVGHNEQIACMHDPFLRGRADGKLDNIANRITHTPVAPALAWRAQSNRESPAALLFSRTPKRTMHACAIRTPARLPPADKRGRRGDLFLD